MPLFLLNKHKKNCVKMVKRLMMCNILVLTVLLAFSCLSALSPMMEIPNPVLVAADRNQLVIFDSQQNKAVVIGRQSNDSVSFNLNFIKSNEIVDYILPGSNDGFYLFCSQENVLYQTDRSFRLINRLLLPIEKPIRLQPEFYENRLQNLIFWDKKNSTPYQLVQNKMQALWLLEDKPSDISYNNGRFYLLYANYVAIRDEKGITYRSASTPAECTKIAAGEKYLFCAVKQSLVLIDLNNNGIIQPEMDMVLPECRFLRVQGGCLLYGTANSILIFNLNEMVNDE